MNMEAKGFDQTQKELPKHTKSWGDYHLHFEEKKISINPQEFPEQGKLNQKVEKCARKVQDLANLYEKIRQHYSGDQGENRFLDSNFIEQYNEQRRNVARELSALSKELHAQYDKRPEGIKGLLPPELKLEKKAIPSDGQSKPEKMKKKDSQEKTYSAWHDPELKKAFVACVSKCVKYLLPLMLATMGNTSPIPETGLSERANTTITPPLLEFFHLNSTFNEYHPVNVSNPQEALKAVKLTDVVSPVNLEQLNKSADTDSGSQALKTYITHVNGSWHGWYGLIDRTLTKGHKFPPDAVKIGLAPLKVPDAMKYNYESIVRLLSNLAFPQKNTLLVDFSYEQYDCTPKGPCSPGVGSDPRIFADQMARLQANASKAVQEQFGQTLDAVMNAMAVMLNVIGGENATTAADCTDNPFAMANIFAKQEQKSPGFLRQFIDNLEEIAPTLGHSPTDAIWKDAYFNATNGKSFDTACQEITIPNNDKSGEHHSDQASDNNQYKAEMIFGITVGFGIATALLSTIGMKYIGVSENTKYYLESKGLPPVLAKVGGSAFELSTLIFGSTGMAAIVGSMVDVFSGSTDQNIPMPLSEGLATVLESALAIYGILSFPQWAYSQVREWINFLRQNQGDNRQVISLYNLNQQNNDQS